MMRHRRVEPAGAPHVSTAASWVPTPEETEQRIALMERRTARLPAFDPEAKCPKCDSGRVDAQFKHLSLGTVFSQPEQIERRCCRCAYTWAERPADKESA